MHQGAYSVSVASSMVSRAREYSNHLLREQLVPGGPLDCDAAMIAAPSRPGLTVRGARDISLFHSSPWGAPRLRRIPCPANSDVRA
jgi:hypothetical protein